MAKVAEKFKFRAVKPTSGQADENIKINSDD